MSKQYKLDLAHRTYVNQLMERAQDDLEGVLFELVGKNVELREVLAERFRLNYDSRQHERNISPKLYKAWLNESSDSHSRIQSILKQDDTQNE